MNYESARALSLHLSGRWSVVEARPVRDTAWGRVKGAWVVRCLAPWGCWVVYSQP